MPEIQQSNVVDNYLGALYGAQDRVQKQQANQYNMQRQQVQDQQQAQQFDQTSQLNQLNLHKSKIDALNQLLGSVPDGNAQAFEAAKQQALAHPELGLKPEDVQNLTVADLPRLKMESGQAAQMLDMQLKRAQIAAQNASIRHSDAATQALMDKPTGSYGANGRPMASGVQTKEDDDIADVQSVQSINTQIGNVLGQLKTGDLDLGPINNLVSRGQNLAGLSTPGSRNFAQLESTLEKMRNDSLRLNKGVQTEGDAQRAWNEITKYITDPKVVAEQLQRVQKLNALAAEQRLNRINIRRQRNGYPPLNPSEIGYGGQQAPADPNDFSDVDKLLGLQ